MVAAARLLCVCVSSSYVVSIMLCVVPNAKRKAKVSRFFKSQLPNIDYLFDTFEVA